MKQHRWTPGREAAIGTLCAECERFATDPVHLRTDGAEHEVIRTVQRLVHEARLTSPEMERYTNWWVAMTFDAIEAAGYRVVVDPAGGAAKPSPNARRTPVTEPPPSAASETAGETK